MTKLTTQLRWNREAKYINQLRAELAQVCDELAHAKIRAHKFETALADACTTQNVLRRNRDFWFETCLSAEKERDKIRKEAEGLRRQLKHAEDAHIYRFKEYDALEIDLCHAAEGEAAIVEAAEALLEQLGWMGKVYQPGLRIEFETARDNLNNTLEHRSDAAAKLLERLAEAQRQDANLAQSRNELKLAQDAVKMVWANNSCLAADYLSSASQLRTGLAQAHEELAREHQVAKATMVELKRVHKSAHEEAEGLRRQLGMLQSAIDNLCEQNERQIDMEDCGRRASYPDKFPDWEQAWDQAYELRHGVVPAAKLLERLATLDAAEQRHQATIDELEQRLTRMRKRLAQAELAAHIHDKACTELAQTVWTERAERQEADTAMHDYARACGELARTRQATEQRAERAEALAALVTERAALLLGRLAEWAGRARGYAVGHWTADDDQIGTDALAAHALAAQIREALALEVNE